MRTLMAWVFIVSSGLSQMPQVAHAQEPARTDSLEAELRRLRARLDSLQRVIDELIRRGQDPSAAGDELARLRAAAQDAAQSAAVGDTTTRGSRTRNLAILNPEISLTGDVVGSYLAPAGESGVVSFVPREFEFSFQAALDPYTHTKVFVAHEEELAIAGFAEDSAEAHGGPEIEEAYLYWVGLPARIGIKAGKFRQEIGLYNRWHTHALFEVERPLAAVALLGEDGLIQTGASLRLPSFSVGPATQTLTTEVTLGDNDVLFDGGSQLSYLGRIQSFWELGTDSYLQVGGTGLTGRNTDTDLDSDLLGIDFTFRWSPPSQARYRDLQIKGEWYFARRTESGIRSFGNGGYGQVNYRFGQQWIVGTRVDHLTPFGGAEPRILQVVPSVTWWQSEWVRLRAQYHYVKPQGLPGSHSVLLQVTWSVGPHKHENY